MGIKSIFYHGLLVAKNCLIPEKVEIKKAEIYFMKNNQHTRMQ